MFKKTTILGGTIRTYDVQSLEETIPSDSHVCAKIKNIVVTLGTIGSPPISSFLDPLHPIPFTRVYSSLLKTQLRSITLDYNIITKHLVFICCKSITAFFFNYVICHFGSTDRSLQRQ